MTIQQLNVSIDDICCVALFMSFTFEFWKLGIPFEKGFMRFI